MTELLVQPRKIKGKDIVSYVLDSRCMSCLSLNLLQHALNFCLPPEGHKQLLLPILLLLFQTFSFFRLLHRVRRDSRLGLHLSYFLVQISRLGLEKLFYRSLGLVSVSEKHFIEVSVSSRSRNFNLAKSRSRSRSRNFNQSWSRSRLGLAKRGLV